MNVAIIGASNKPDRYSYKALKLLKENGHKVFPVHVRIKDIEGEHVFPSINDIGEDINTITMYVAKDVSDKLSQDILNKDPKRIIFNPGAENEDLSRKAQESGISTVNACTLVMLKTGQF